MAAISSSNAELVSAFLTMSLQSAPAIAEPTNVNPYIDKFTQLLQTPDSIDACRKLIGRQDHVQQALSQLLETYSISQEKEHPTQEYLILKKAVILECDPYSKYYTGNLVITKKAVKFLIKELSKKHSVLQNKPIIQAIDRRDFYHKLVKRMKKLEENESCFFLLPTGDMPHWTPIYVQRNANVYRFLLTDSLAGKEMQNPFDARGQTSIRGAPSQIALRYIEAAAKECGVYEKTKVFIHMGEARQFDRQNCLLFACKDIVHIAYMPEIFDWIQEHGGVEPHASHQEHVSNFNYLPPQFMKIAQSMKAIERYISVFGKDALTLRRNHGGYESLQTAIERHKENDKNAKITKMFYKYERKLLLHLVSLHGNNRNSKH